MLPRSKPQWDWLWMTRVRRHARDLPFTHRCSHIRPASTGTNSEHSSTDPTEYCRELVRKHDYEGFLISQFYPKDLQGGYFALKAFSVGRVVLNFRFPLNVFTIGQVELAMIQDNTSNQMIGQMRMQFWRDALKGINDVLVYNFLARRAETHFGRPTGAATEASNCACLARGFAAFPSTNVLSQTDC
jgi:NADH dehydrogenase [ubiquinone] 1 alpha subcomplex assembly factor 6